MIHVLAIITAKPGQREALLAIVQRECAPPFMPEDGCIEYGAVIDVEGTQPAFGSDTFVVVRKKWTSIEALKAHAASPHMAAYGIKSERSDRGPRGSRDAAGMRAVGFA